MPITLLLADDHRIVRQGLKALLTADPRFDVLAEADNGRSAVQLASELSPDVVVMDFQMPDLNGIEATRQIMQHRPQTKVIGLSGHTDVKLSVALLDAGACGYVLKDAAVDELIIAITTAMRGEKYVSPSLIGAVMHEYGHARSDGRGTAGPALSPREEEVLQLIASGRSTKQAARDLKVSVKTIETHRRNLMEKLKIDNIAELTKYAIRCGLASL